jgi:hypothetical protein
MRALVVILLISLAGCVSFKDSNHIRHASHEELLKDKYYTEVELNHMITKEYAKQKREKNEIIAIENLGWDLTYGYITTIPELKKVWTEFEKADQNLHEFLMKDFRYNEIMQRYTQQSLADKKSKGFAEFTKEKDAFYDLMQSTSSEYRDLRAIRDGILCIAYSMALVDISNDYYIKDKIIPVEWIPQDELKKLKFKLSIYPTYCKFRLIEKQLTKTK